MSKRESLAVEILITALVNPTESVEKVERAIRNVIGDIQLKQRSTGDSIILEGRLTGIESLYHLRDLLKKQRIREAGRSFLSRRSEGSTLSFGINRQAAYVGRLSFYRSQEAPLGPIQVTVRGDAEKVIDFLCETEIKYKR